MDSSPPLISRDEISSGALARQRRARLLVQRILERLQSPQAPAGEPEDALARQLAGVRRRAAAPGTAIQASDLLEGAERWQDLLPSEPLLREEVLAQLQRRLSLAAEDARALARLTGTGTRRWIPWRLSFPLHTPAAWPVGVKLGGVMLLFSLVPALLVGNVGSWLAEGQAERSLEKQLQGIAATVAGRLDENLSEYGKLMQYLASNPAVIRMAGASPGERPLLGSEVLGLLDRLQASHADAAFIYLIDRTGRCFASSDRKLIGHDYSFRTYVQQGLRREAYMSGVYYPVSTTNPRAAVSITRPIRQGSAVVGVAVVGIYSLAESRALDLKTGLTALVLENDGVIASSNDPRLAMGILGPDDGQAEARRRRISHNDGIDQGQRFRRLLTYHPLSVSLKPLLASKQAGVGAGAIDGQELVAAWQPLEAYGAKAVVIESQQAHRQAIQVVQRKVMLLTSLLGLLATGGAVLASRTISRPLRSLTQAAAQLETDQSVEEEQLSAVIRRKDDLGVLGRQLLQAARESLKRQASLRAQVAALHIKIDQKQRDRDVAVIVESEFFGELKAAAAQLRAQRQRRRLDAAGSPSPIDSPAPIPQSPRP
jgi:hypothetical protein